MQQFKIKGLSLTRPWPFAFVNGPEPEQKRIENRSWKPPQGMIGHYLALHAAKSWSEEDRLWIASRMGLLVPKQSEHPHSQIFAVCRVAGYIESAQDERLKPEQCKWFFGPYGWLLEDLVELKTPVTCTGARLLWGFDGKEDVLEKLRASYREALELQRVA